MYLKKLEVQGFKSFADKTQLNFKRGITAIVGPNGSGKSNISDALRWVMGEQSVKSLRGSNMQDVIFSGTQTRKAVGFAEVSLTIDNSTRLLLTDYSEVTITRRLYRSGESEYFINKTACRLKDIHELLMDTGLGRDGYCIIGQGKINEILSVRSEERRQIFDEAAGISKYRYRKEEAERKLLHTEENLNRISDIISELQMQLEPLRQQSERAKKFLVLREELKVLEVNTLLEGVDRIRVSLDDVNRAYKDVSEQAENINNEIQLLENEIQKLYEESKMSDLQAEEYRQKEQETRKLQNSFKNEIALFKNKIEFGKQTIARLTDEINQINEKINQLKNEIEKNDKEKATLKEKEDELYNEIEKIDAQAAALDESAERDKTKIETLQADIIERMNTVAELRAKLGNLQTIRETYQERNFNIEQELLQKNAAKQQREKQLLEAESQLQENKQLIEDAKADIEQNEQEIIKLKNIRNELLNRQRVLESEHSEKSARLKMLTDMEKDFEGYSKSVKAIMHSSKRGSLSNIKVYGTVAQLFDVPKKYAVAIETALGGAMQFIVTENEQDAKTAITYLKKKNLGRATFLPVSVASGNLLQVQGLEQCTGFIGLACDLISCDKKYAPVAKSLLGRIAVVDNIDNAIIIAKKYKYKFRIVTLEGELLAPGGLMTGGSQSHSSGIFTRANEMKLLSKQVKDIEATLYQLKKKIESTIKNLHSVEQKNTTQLSLLQDFEQKKVQLILEIEHNRSLIDEINKNIVSLKREREEIETLTRSIDEDSEEIKLQIKEIENSIEDSRLIMEKMKLDSTGAEDEREKIKSQRLSIRMSLSELQKDIAVITERSSSLQSEINAYTISIESKKAELESEKENIQELEEDIQFKNQQIRDQDELLLELKNAASSAIEARRGADEDVKIKQGLAKEKMQDLMKIKQELSRLESKKEKAELEMETIINRLWDDYELTLTNAEEYRKDIGSYTKAQRRVKQIKNEIKDLGNINVDAIEEYKNVKERFEFLDGQRNDLVAAKRNLEKIIKEMLDIMKKQFSEQFGLINQEFSKVFSELFEGGKASLSLEDPNNILESGVDIYVQPSGKQLQNMLLLSGGEKSLTAIALLFAILKVRPTPFCILDEIDAELDDANVLRYTNYIRNFSDKTQFILITHKRETMESSDVLYGVTMQEKGVSSVLTLNLEEVNA